MEVGVRLSIPAEGQFLFTGSSCRLVVWVYVVSDRRVRRFTDLKAVGGLTGARRRPSRSTHRHPVKFEVVVYKGRGHSICSPWAVTISSDLMLFARRLRISLWRSALFGKKCAVCSCASIAAIGSLVGGGIQRDPRICVPAVFAEAQDELAPGNENDGRRSASAPTDCDADVCYPLVKRCSFIPSDRRRSAARWARSVIL